LFALSDAICVILRRLLGDRWNVGYKPAMGLRDPVDGRLAAVMIELRAGDAEEAARTTPPSCWPPSHARTPWLDLFRPRRRRGPRPRPSRPTSHGSSRRSRRCLPGNERRSPDSSVDCEREPASSP